MFRLERKQSLFHIPQLQSSRTYILCKWFSPCAPGTWRGSNLNSIERMKVGIIGAGAGIRTHLPAWKSLPNAEVVGIACSSPQSSRGAAAKHSISTAFDSVDDLLADTSIDLVCVASPTEYHKEHVS